MGKLRIVMAVGAALLVAACNRDNTGGSDQNSQSYGQGSSRDKDPANYAPNNTGRNERDRSGDTLTAGDQGGNDSDREITRQVRRTIVSNDQLSSEAKNVKIITQNGKVTLRGPVNSAQEQQTIANLAKGVQGVTSIDNQLEVKSTQ